MAKRNDSQQQTAPATEQPNSTETVGAVLLRKITIKDVCGHVGELLEEMMKLKNARGSYETLPLLRVYGIARRFKVGETDKGEFVKFIGQFAAVNLRTKKEFQSGQCILPMFVGEQIHAAMQGASGEEMNESQWAFEIGAHFDSTAVTKYVYDIRPLKEPGQSDALALLRQSVDARALAAPSDMAKSG